MFDDPVSECLGGFDEGWVIEQDKGGKWSVRLRSLRGTFFTTGCIECFHHGMKELSLPVNIKSPSPLGIARILFIDTPGEIEVAIVSRGLKRFNTGPTDFRNK